MSAEVRIETVVGSEKCFARVEILGPLPSSQIVTDAVSKCAEGDEWHSGVGEQLAVARALRDAARVLMRQAYWDERHHPSFRPSIFERQASALEESSLR